MKIAAGRGDLAAIRAARSPAFELRRQEPSAESMLDRNLSVFSNPITL
jgi:hypothetical protein